MKVYNFNLDIRNHLKRHYSDQKYHNCRQQTAEGGGEGQNNKTIIRYLAPPCQALWAKSQHHGERSWVQATGEILRDI